MNDVQALRKVVDGARAGDAAETHGPAEVGRILLRKVELGPAWALAVRFCRGVRRPKIISS